MNDLYKTITERLIKQITETGKLPWHKPWRDVGGDGPINLSSGKAYRGINVAMLWGGDTDYWVTFKQAQQLGGQVKAGSKSTPVVFWKFFQHKDAKTDKAESIPMLKHYNVFNLSQCEGLEPPEPIKLADHERNDRAQSIIDGYNGPDIDIKQRNRACYIPSKDVVEMPELGQFDTPDDYYSVFFHELGHSTGHESRLKRDMSGMFGNHKYSKEELIAEFTACFLCKTAGINTTVDTSAAYLKSWVSKFNDDPKLLLWAAGRAQKAADLITGYTYDTE